MARRLGMFAQCFSCPLHKLCTCFDLGKFSQFFTFKTVSLTEYFYYLCSHVMNELLSTERTYVDELKSIVDGYGKPIDSDEFAHIVPEQLKGKKRVLLGNMEDIYRFHEKIFLAELEECRNEPQLVGQCFVKQVRTRCASVLCVEVSEQSARNHFSSSIASLWLAWLLDSDWPI